MYKFIEKNGLNLVCDGKTVLKNISFWLNPRLFAYKATSFEDKIVLEKASVSETEVRFVSGDNVGGITLTLKQDGDCFALFACGEYDGRGGKGQHGCHLDPFCGLGFDFEFPHRGNFIDAFMRCSYWQKPYIGNGKIKPRTQGLFFNQSNRCVYLMATCHRDFKTEMFPEKKGASLRAQSNNRVERIDECIFIGGVGKSVYELGETVAAFGLEIMQKPGKLRKNKEYPEIFEYLGWCSWDAFHMFVTHQNLIDKAQEFKDKEIPVKWVILDDMWGDVPQNDVLTMHSRELESWEAAPDRFPKGLKGITGELKENFGLKVGIWHPINGYWSGIDPRGSLAKEHGDLLEYNIPGIRPDQPRLMHSFEKKKCEKYYDIQHKFYSDCGIDFTKVDNQGSTQWFSFLKGSIGECAENLHNAIEKAAKKYYGGALINCMGMPIENLWNRTYSNINRFSGDFQPENRDWFVHHLLQCSYNSLTQGAIFTGDWDMWWSDDGQATKNAVLRSMSGGPIYMSDELNRSIKDVIMPTVLSSGRIIRLKNPARPTADCLFENPEENKKVFKVFNTGGKYGVVAVFDLDSADGSVSGTVSPLDAGLDGNEYVLYDWFNETATPVKRGESINVTLNNRDDFRLYIICPVKDIRAVIGLKEKYMTFGGIRQDKDGINALDDGTLLICENGKINSVKVKKDEFINVN